MKINKNVYLFRNLPSGTLCTEYKLSRYLKKVKKNIYKYRTQSKTNRNQLFGLYIITSIMYK